MADRLDVDIPIVEVDPITKEFKATAYFEDYLFKVIQSLGGEGAPPVTDIETREVSTHTIASQLKSIQHRLSEFDSLFDTSRLSAALKDTDIRTANFYSKIKITNYTAVNKDWIEGRGRMRLYLPENAARDDEVMFSNGDGSSMIVDGNGNNIKYTTTDTTFATRNKGSSYHFQYFEDNVLNERYWRVR